MGVFGDDEAAKHVYKTVSDMGIDVSHCRFYHGENGYAEVRLDDGDRVFIGSNHGGVSKEHPIDFLTDIELDYIAEYVIQVFSAMWKNHFLRSAKLPDLYHLIFQTDMMRNI